MAVNPQLNTVPQSATSDPSLWSYVGPAIQAGVGVAGSLGSASAGAGGYNNAAGTVAGALGTSGAALSPFQQGGTTSLSALENLYGLGGKAPDFSAFTSSPGYQFQQQQGDQAINRAAAASGNAFSSTTLAALGKYNSGLASTQYQQYLQNLYGLTQLGANAATARGSQAITGATAQGGFQGQSGQQTASGVAGAAGSLGNLAGKLPWQQIGNAITGSGSSAAPNTGNANGLNPDGANAVYGSPIYDPVTTSSPSDGTTDFGDVPNP